MKGSKAFEDTIQKYLNKRAEDDKVFKEKLEHKDFRIEKCVGYILHTVKESGVNGFEDNEVFSMAMHYVDEYQAKNFKQTDGLKMQVVVNHKVELTPEEIQEAKDKARETILDEARKKMTKKPKKKVVVVEEGEKKQPIQSDLFL